MKGSGLIDVRKRPSFEPSLVTAYFQMNGNAQLVQAPFQAPSDGVIVGIHLEAMTNSTVHLDSAFVAVTTIQLAAISDLRSGPWVLACVAEYTVLSGVPATMMSVGRTQYFPQNFVMVRSQSVYFNLATSGPGIAVGVIYFQPFQ